MKGFGFAIAIIVAALVATAPADAKRGKKNRATGPVEQTLAVVDDYCATYCQPSEPTPLAGTACDTIHAICLADDGTGFPNCAWVVRSCD